MEKHVFFVRSDFQYIVCKGIIEKLKLCVEDCIFVTDRGTQIESVFFQSPIYGIERYLHLRERLNYYFKNKRFVKDFFRNARVTVYMPFSFHFPSQHFNEFVFFEEGLSSYSTKQSETQTNTLQILFLKLLVWIISPFNKNIRGYLVGFICQEKKPKKLTRLISFSENCYKNVCERFVQKEVIPVPSKPVESYFIPKGSTILIFDRFSEKGRPFDLENYKKCVERCLERLKAAGIDHIFIKYHPADIDNNKSKAWMGSIIRTHGVDAEQFTGRLEYLALQNIGTHFIGANSTILFYAPMLGNSNKASSFCMELAAMDNSYKRFLDNWGDFENFFSKNVECL